MEKQTYFWELTWWINGSVCQLSVSDKIFEIISMERKKGSFGSSVKGFYHGYLARWVLGCKEAVIISKRAWQRNSLGTWEWEGEWRAFGEAFKIQAAAFSALCPLKTCPSYPGSHLSSSLAHQLTPCSLKKVLFEPVLKNTANMLTSWTGLSLRRFFFPSFLTNHHNSWGDWRSKFRVKWSRDLECHVFLWYLLGVLEQASIL